MSPVKGKLAEALITLRGEKSLYRVSQESGIPRSMLFRYENGSRLPEDANLEKLAKALMVSIYDLKKLYFEDLYPVGSENRSYLKKWVEESTAISD